MKEKGSHRPHAFFLRVSTAYMSLHPKVGDDKWTKDFVVMRLSDEEKLEREQRQREEKQALLNRKLGFRRVFKLLADAKKPLIGHNCMFDILFMMSHFAAPLPDNWEEVQEAVHSLFPLV